MACFDEVMQRLRRDAAFADAVHLDPTYALRGYDLGEQDRLRIARIVDPAANPSPSLFRSSGDEDGIDDDADDVT